MQEKHSSNLPYSQASIGRLCKAFIYGTTIFGAVDNPKRRVEFVRYVGTKNHKVQ